MTPTRRFTAVAVATMLAATTPMLAPGPASAAAHGFQVSHLHHHCGASVIRFRITVTGLSPGKHYDLALVTATRPRVTAAGGFDARHRAVHGRHVLVTVAKGSMPRHKVKAQVYLLLGSNVEFSHRSVTVPHCER